MLPEGIWICRVIVGTRWLSTTNSFRPFDNFCSTGLGSFTLRTSLETGALLYFTTPAIDCGCGACGAWAAADAANAKEKIVVLNMALASLIFLSRPRSRRG